MAQKKAIQSHYIKVSGPKLIKYDVKGQEDFLMAIPAEFAKDIALQIISQIQSKGTIEIQFGGTISSVKQKSY